MHNISGFHHLHKRKRRYVKHQPYPHPNKWKNLMDKLIYIIAIIGPVIAFPQVFDIWFYKDVGGVSIITWSGFLIASIFWIVYGIMHEEKPIYIANSIWALVHILIITGVIVFM